MQFYVIYEFDTERDCSVKPYNPPFKSKFFHLTERGASEYSSYDRWGAEEGPGKHRKYAGIITKAQFQALVNAQDLRMDDCETMGSLTVELGHIPAVSFGSTCNGYLSLSAYVTPLIERKGGCTDRDWDRAAAALKSMYA